MTRGDGGLHGTAILCRDRPIRVLCGWAHLTFRSGRTSYYGRIPIFCACEYICYLLFLS